jgi:hypothetical protein
MHMCRTSSLAAPLYNTFPHYPTNDTILQNGYWAQNVCFEFVYNIFHSKKNWERYGQKCMLVFM